MSWFSRRKSKSRDKADDRRGLTQGPHRSPGLALIEREIARRPPRAILDLGGSSTETVGFFSSYCTNISIQGLFQSAGAPAGNRSQVFRFTEEVFESLPDGDERFDVVLIWDLLHYFEPALQERCVARLAALCHPDALVLLVASANTPIPTTPIHFKVRDQETLEYGITTEARAPSPQLRTRDIELIMAGFQPVRLFQLRNGLQEFVFRYVAPLPTADGAAAARSDSAIKIY